LIDRTDAQMRTADIQTEYNHNGSYNHYTTNKEPRRPFRATLTPYYSEFFAAVSSLFIKRHAYAAGASSWAAA
jgi:hypothetical protein